MIQAKTLERQALAGQANRDWYQIGRDELHRAATNLQTCPERFALLLAAYSPRVHVVRAFRNAAYHVQHNRRPPGSMRLHWQLATEGLDRGFLKGPKIEAFRRAILGDGDSLVLDVWACRGMKIEQAKCYQAKIFRRVRERFETVADRLGWAVAEVQAAQWLTIRRDHGFQNSPLIPEGLV